MKAALKAAVAAWLVCVPAGLALAQAPAPKDGMATLKDFRFASGETLPELHMAYTTLGDPAGEPVLVLHGTFGSAQTMLIPGFGGQLFGPGQPLDAAKYFIIIPDSLGTGRSSKPSDGMQAKFPKYDYDDMVEAQYRLVTEHLGVKHLRLVIGNSMGGMHSWLWGVRYPGMMDALIPMASQPTEMAARNWMMRRLMIETIKADPDYKDGFYTTQPKMMRFANVMYGTATNGGDLAYEKEAPTRALADKLVDQRLAAPPPRDANDFIYQWAASANYNPAPKLGSIEAHVLAINSDDDERNPPQTGLTEAAMKQVRHGRLLLLKGTADTRGHSTTGALAGLYATAVADFLATVPKR